MCKSIGHIYTAAIALWCSLLPRGLKSRRNCVYSVQTAKKESKMHKEWSIDTNKIKYEQLNKRKLWPPSQSDSKLFVLAVLRVEFSKMNLIWIPNGRSFLNELRQRIRRGKLLST